MTTPLLGTSEIAESVANQVPTHNLALRQIEARTIRALSMITMAPPAAVEGDSYIIPAGATGAWLDKTGQIASFIGGAWSYCAPIEGIRLWINDLDAEYVYDGAAWVANYGGGSDVSDAIAAHEAAEDPHSQYLTQTDGDARYLQAIGAQPFDLTAFYPGVPSASAIVTRVPVARDITFPASLTGSIGNATVAATAQTDFDVQKNGATVGTIRFAAASTSATFIAASAITLAAGDILSVSAPATPDTTLSNVGFVLAGTR